MTEATPQRRKFMRLRGNTIEVFGRTVRLPANRAARMGMGIALVLGGVFSFLPLLGIWMLPLGLLVLSIDLRFVRRWRRRAEVRWGRRRAQRSLLPTAEPGPGKDEVGGRRRRWFGQR